MRRITVIYLLIFKVPGGSHASLSPNRRSPLITQHTTTPNSVRGIIQIRGGSSEVGESSTTTTLSPPPSPLPSTTDTTETMKNTIDNKTNDPKRQAIEYVFSDVDGTLIHLPSSDATDGTIDDNNNTHTHTHQPKPSSSSSSSSEEQPKILQLPPSSTGMRGIISAKTLELCSRLRNKNHNVKLVLVSGMRTSTLLERLPYLPRADAYASESGGRIFYPVVVPKAVGGESSSSSSSLLLRPVAFRGSTEEDRRPILLEEDREWRGLMALEDSAGVDGYCGDVADACTFVSGSGGDGGGGSDVAAAAAVIPLAERKSALWDFANGLVAKGFVVDCKCYASCFRVNRRQQRREVISDEEFDALSSLDVSGLGLGSSTNLGCIDFYPIRSGKKNCCAYLAKKFSSTQNDDSTTATNNRQQLSGEELLSQRAVCLCDDDNDLEMALACQTAYLPSITSSSMEQAARDYPDRIIIVERKEENITSTVATEYALSRVLDEVRVLD